MEDRGEGTVRRRVLTVGYDIWEAKGRPQPVIAT